MDADKTRKAVGLGCVLMGLMMMVLGLFLTLLFSMPALVNP